MIIICEHCGTDHRVAEESFRKSKYATLICRGCRKHIRIILCPGCHSPHIRHDSDREVLCITCGTSVMNGLPGYAGENCSPETNLPSPVTGDDASSCAADCIEKISAMPERPLEKPQGISENKEPGASIIHETETVSRDEFPAEEYLHSPFLQRFTMRELLQVAGESLKPHALIPAIVAACIIMIMAAVPQPRAVSYDGSNFFRGFSNLLFPATYLFIYLTASAVICRMVLGRVLGGRISVNGTGLFILRAVFPILAVNGIFVMFTQCLVAYAGKIPYSGPVFFGLALLPLYCLSLLLMLLVLSVFWFLPPVVADRCPPFTRIPETLFNFISRYGLRLCYTVPVLMLASLAVIVPLAMLHYSAMSFLLGYASVGLFFPVKLHVQSVGGRLTGLSMWAISMACLGLSISIMSVMSVHVYLFMERGLHTGAGRFSVLLTFLSLVLLGYLLMMFI